MQLTRPAAQAASSSRRCCSGAGLGQWQRRQVVTAAAAAAAAKSPSPAPRSAAAAALPRARRAADASGVRAAAAAWAAALAAMPSAAVPPHVVLAPPPGNAAPPETEALLVFVHGAFLAPEDYVGMAEQAQAAAPDVRLWAVCAGVDWPSFFAAQGRQQQQQGQGGQGGSGATPPPAPQAPSPLEALLAGAVGAAGEAGFKPRRTPGFQRATNVYLVAHSVAGVAFSDAAFKSVAGLVLLGSTFDARYVTGRLPSLEDWGRPVMLLGGELDGQMRWPWHAPLAVDAAVLAQKAGPTYAAAQHPFILVPGANHGQTSNGVANFARGDIRPDADPGASTAAFAGAIGEFVAAHEAGSAPARAAAADALLLRVRQTAELLAPYLMAMGMGDVCAAWVTGRQGGPEATASLDAPEHHPHPSPAAAPHQHQHQPQQQHQQHQQPLLQGARREAGARVSAALHPGVVQKTERFVAAAQLRLVASLPKEALARLRVVVHTHTDLEALLYNQPRAAVQPDGSVVVAVHALLALPNAVRPGHPLPHTQPAAPEVWVKLKRPQAIAEELGLSGGGGKTPLCPDATTAAALNQLALDAALAAAPVAAAARYRARGLRLVFGPDAVSPPADAEGFVRRGAMRFEQRPAADGFGADGDADADAAAGSSSSGAGRQQVVVVTAPVLTSPSPGELAASQQQQGPPGIAADRYMSRFLGNFYCKILSVGQAMEWVMLDSLRDSCTWGMPADDEGAAAAREADGK